MPDQNVSLPPDVGLCEACNARNSKRALRCHACAVLLPWAPQPKTEKPKAAKLPAAPKISAPSVNSETATVWGVGMLVFLVSLFPPLGYRLYRYFSNDESPLANFAATGALIGLALFIWGVMGTATTSGHAGAGNAVSGTPATP